MYSSTCWASVQIERVERRRYDIDEPDAPAIDMTQLNETRRYHSLLLWQRMSFTAHTTGRMSGERGGRLGIKQRQIS